MLPSKAINNHITPAIPITDIQNPPNKFSTNTWYRSYIGKGVMYANIVGTVSIPRIEPIPIFFNRLFLLFFFSVLILFCFSIFYVAGLWVHHSTHVNIQNNAIVPTKTPTNNKVIVVSCAVHVPIFPEHMKANASL